MTTATLTLTEFLLARIGEDEAVAGLLKPKPSSPMSESYGHSHFIADPTSPARVLAECAAKKDIIFGLSGTDFSNPIERRLAVPYADHPDYRDEWRP